MRQIQILSTARREQENKQNAFHNASLSSSCFLTVLSLLHQSLGFLAMQALCTLLLLFIPLPFRLKAEGTRGILVLNQTPYIKQEENTQSHFNLLKGEEPCFKSDMSSAISLSLEESLRRGVQCQGVGLMILDESSSGYCHKPAGCTRTRHFTFHVLSLFFSYLMVS